MRMEGPAAARQSGHYGVAVRPAQGALAPHGLHLGRFAADRLLAGSLSTKDILLFPSTVCGRPCRLHVEDRVVRREFSGRGSSIALARADHRFAEPEGPGGRLSRQARAGSLPVSSLKRPCGALRYVQSHRKTHRSVD
jgi:hypothetical protein